MKVFGRAVRTGTALLLSALLAIPPAAWSDQPRPSRAAAMDYVPPLAPLVSAPSSELREVVERFSSDRFALLRRYGVEYSPERRAALGEFLAAWKTRLAEIPFDTLGQNARIDYVLLRTRLESETAALALEEKIVTEAGPLVPFAGKIFSAQESRRRLETIDPAAAAAMLAQLHIEIEKTRKAVEASLPRGEGRGPAPSQSKEDAALKPSKIVAWRATLILESLRRTLEQWNRYYSGYHPLFTWWTAAPYKKVDQALQAYRRVLRERVIGIREGEDEPIIGYPIGRDALLAELGFELIPYTPEQLIAIAEREFAWCEAEMKKASREMGFGDDWKAALEKVKTLHVPPGEQPDLIRDLAWEATEFVTSRNLVTVPPLARDIWRMEMMTPERQKEAPFFLGGEVIQVSFPTDTMDQDDKLMSMRGNNIHFARATVHHELIPGHLLQGFMTDRYNSHRRAFSTPFWTEGWALYWEMLLWDLNFPRSPEDRVGMLFWRMHRCARIIFSLSYHLGTMTPEQCIDFLVDRVGHERANATAEVRRSFRGAYPPLYQLAYMMGALQFRALEKELVKSGKMSYRDFHDAVLQGGRMPVEMVRAMLTGAPLTRDYTTRWKFEGEIRAAPAAGNSRE
jgi:hypothetical protein